MAADPFPSGPLPPGPFPGAPVPAGERGALLVVCALGVERLALRLADRPPVPTSSPESPRPTVLRTGMGPRAAARAVGRALARPELRDAAVLATGFCAGLVPGMRPGDLVVAEETRDALGGVRCAGTASLAEALTRALPGRTVHTGPLTGSDHVVRGAERAALRATGAVAVDMESAVTLRTAVGGGAGSARPVAAVRVVVDAPDHELLRIGTLRGGISAFRVLRAVLPVFREWHRIVTLPRR
ncbi:phosphorylase family protein [Streptomyces sp. JNUCC 64]